MVQPKKPSDMSNTNGTTKHRDQQSNMSFQRGGNRNDGRVQNGNTPSFRTDSAISGNRNQGERVLQRWVPDAPEDVDTSLESGRTQTGGAVWDQFAENERRFGLKTDYDENIYTTTIDKSHPLYRQRLAEADRKAKEIERSVATNSHVAEERITDNIKAGSNGLDEEDKYSGVRRQQDFPPLTSSNNKYTPPARRAPTGQATVSGAPVDPAIISSQLARPDKALGTDKAKVAPKTTKPEVSTPPIAVPTVAPVAPVATPASTKPAAEIKASPLKAAVASTTGSTSRTASPKTQPDGVPNATATVERDVASAFKGFAAQQRRNVDQIRQTKARNDKEVKLNDLKKFADTFKLNTPVPADLVGIIAKDPAKQKEIQEKAKRNAEEAKVNPSEAVKPITPQSDSRPPAQRPAVANTGSSPAGVPSRQNPSRGPSLPHQGPYTSNSFRADRTSPSQSTPPVQQAHPTGGLAARLRNGAQNKHTQPPVNPIPARLDQNVPTGPSMTADPNISRRSSGISSAQGARLNPNSSEFRPNAFAPAFNPNGNPSAASSPRSTATTVVDARQTPPASRSLLKRKPITEAQRPSIKGKFNALDHIKTLKPAAGMNWDKTGGLKPAFATPPTWKQPGDNEDPKSAILETYKTMFEKAPFPTQPMSPMNPSHAVPQVPHQHQLPFHLQQQNMHSRQSPRQPPTHLQNQHGHGPNPSFNGPDDHHRMMPSHSAQSYASPRLQNVPMAFPSPMSQPAQMFNGQMMQYPSPQMTRQFSQGQQFIPQPTHMAPIMMQNPANGYIGPQGMGPGPQMMYPPQGQGHFIPPGNGPPGMPVNGYPSPGRSAPMMMNQGSQQGHQQPMYGMSPGQQYGQMAPMYAQQQPGQMPMRGYGPQQFGTSPQQMHQYGGQHRNHQNGNYNNNKNFQQNGPHPNASPNNQAPTGPQPRPVESGEEAK